jgi:hypothetical protein
MSHPKISPFLHNFRSYFRDQAIIEANRQRLELVTVSTSARVRTEIFVEGLNT